MSLSVTANYDYVMVNGATVPFSASGGTSPYVFSIQAGGAGGTIDPVSGLYTPPGVVGEDIVVVTDAALDTAAFQMNVGTIIELFADVIQTSMGLAYDQIYLMNQKYTLPTDSRLYIAIGFLRFKPFGRSNVFDGDGTGLSTIQSTNIMATLNVDMFSKSTAAMDQVGQLVIALESPYSLQQQELNSFRIFPISLSIANLSGIEGIAIPYRFNLSVNVQYLVSNVVDTQYYDTFELPTIIMSP